MANKQYHISFACSGYVRGVREFITVAESKEEAIEKVKYCDGEFNIIRDDTETNWDSPSISEIIEVRE